MSSPSASASASASASPMRRIVVAHRLPLRAEPNPESRHGFDFTFDPDSLTLQLSRGLPGQILFVGALPAAASVPVSDDLAAYLLEGFSCYTVSLPPNLAGFSDHILLPLARSTGSAQRYADQIYENYLTHNSMFVDRLLEILNIDTDILHVHDFQLWPLPAMLRRRSPRARMGFCLHSTFPSADLFGAMLDRERAMVLRSLLNADVVAFHSYQNALFFLNSCTSILGVQGRTSRGSTVISYNGRTVLLVILTVGVDLDQLPSPGTADNADEYKGRLLAVDPTGFFRGTGLKILSVEKLVSSRPDLRRDVVLVQINNPMERHEHVDEIIAQVLSVRRFLGDAPIMLIEGAVPMWCDVASWARSFDLQLQHAVHPVMAVFANEGYLSRIFRVGMPEHGLVSMVTHILERLLDLTLTQDDEGAYTLGLRLTNLGAYLMRLDRGLTQANQYIDQVTPYMELFGTTLGDGPIALPLQNLAALLKQLSQIMGKSTIGLKVAAKLLSKAGSQLQLRHPDAQTGGVTTVRASLTEIIMVTSVQHAKTIITDWRKSGTLVKAEVEGSMSTEEARDIHRTFLRNGAYDLISASENLLDKVQDVDESDWILP